MISRTVLAESTSLSTNIVDKDGHSIPPGPLLRYAFLRKYPERALQAWAKKYGPLFSLWMGNQLFVIVSDPIIAKDLLVTNGAIFSSRKQYFMKNQTILHGRAITASSYDDRWRQHRRIAASVLTAKAIDGYAHVLDYEAHILIKSLYQASQGGRQPVNPAHFCGRYALNNMLSVSFATRTDSTDDPLVERALWLATEFMTLTGPTANIVDFIKPLQWIPTRTRSRGRAVYRGIMEVYGAMIERVRSRLDRGEDVPDCLVKTLILTQEKEKLDQEDLSMLSAVFTLGGVHSTAGVIQWFLALISAYPDVQKRAHAELDATIGRDSWPCASDEMRLPYIRAIIKEVERAHSPFWLATPHKLEQDFVYNGMFIPKDTAVILNCYGIHHNDTRYSDSFTFSPDRYLGNDLTCAESAKLADPTERDHWAFGAGRRICPGIHVAERELWLAISRLLWAFEIQSVPGEPISLDEYEGESGRTPLPYRIIMRPRHEHVLTLLDVEEEVKLFSLQ
ncbi:cytochrome P450 [Vararia minispora EC-137]|uniref:Cytochrome P450 n=1 Tax=Vararia minispora EC-137 TaxID=1314806 RepID=A0ACB8QZE2_9AGAM|nr:cytochrome P450 [Vararia minispora EC-137]